MKKMKQSVPSVPLRIVRSRKFKLQKIFVLALCVLGCSTLLGTANATAASPNSDLFQVEQQKKTVKGVVTDDTGEPIPGVSVLVKGTTIGQITNFDGQYVLDVPADNDTIVFSFVGLKTLEEVVGNRTEINVMLESDAVDVDEVVVTALGIRRDKKTLTYASQQVSGEELLKSKDINFMNSLSGKTAGLEIRKSSSGAGGSTRTVLRGSRSVSGLTEPLYVIDGIPMVNHKGGQPGMWGGTDQGDGLSQINPEDIESINILKGANAAVLYGSQGANGVVIITTKKAKEGRVDVTFSSSAVFESIMAAPELQFDYGSEAGAKESWSYTKGNYDSDYVDDFFQTGHNLVNNLSINGGNNRTSVYFSYGNTSSSGIVPNNDYQKHNVMFKQSTKLFNDKVRVSSNVMLVSEKTDNRNTAGYYLNPLTGLYLFPRDKDFQSYKDNYEVFNTDRNMYLQNWFVEDHFQSNPYWVINKEPKTDLSKRLIASATLEYFITDKLKFQARGNVDYAVKSYEQQHAAGSNPTNVSANGRWQYQKYEDKSVYTDGIFTYQNDFGAFSLDATLGASYQETVLGDGIAVDNGTNDLLYPNEFFFQNLPFNVQVRSIYAGKVIKQGVFGNFQLGFKEMLFLDLSGRNDWASTLAGTGNDSYFYPAIGLTGIVSEMVTLPDFISFGKVRASSTTVANEVPFNKINPQHSINSGGGVDRNTQQPFRTLKPEMQTSIELGTDWRFFNGRFGFDFTYYHVDSKDQFIPLPAPSGSGYTTYFINAGKIVNKGVELTVNTIPVKTRNFTWNSTFNYSKNNSEVEELVPEFEDKRIDLGSSEGYSTYLLAGGSFYDLYGYKFQRNEQGQIILDEKTGKPQKTTEREYLGNLEPEWSLGWNNSMRYKNVSLSFLINAKVGGKVVSQTESMLDGYGVSKRTGDARDNGGVVAINAIQGTTPVTEIDAKTYYTTIGDRNGILEAYVYDRTNVRLSQLALTYDFDMTKLSLPLKAASVSLVGQNLFFIYKDAPYDPELAMNTGLGSQSLDNFNLPSTRTYGFNLKITF
ncbi:TonB-linked SusC/RagA family outer membrane protein [Sunxiuqinia elliptica]|uniref:TonB-linked SusC/RagA family outer membrane protein n=1 Tax=Sunxiuqinia elliptica TaxID=655355 RepID=A0A1I2EKV1_9BACT|nr:TonB-linked SusC/RagA family outer membrane protein [Sunxiuqinia elliptica]TDO64316.1 TonB-linked SusC/RagA family outer membrane protein [Sunxiuqinia elliptica]SFE92870.1 TonB-linked outer membrane protein, SusC/RagA family [Sunxiuqinia elliptica]